MAFHQAGLLLVLFVLGSDCFVLEYTKDPNEERSVILLAFSGLRWKSIYENELPNIRKLAADGVLVNEKRTAFQSETLPSLQTIVTGLYPEKHGMLANKMRDLSNGDQFDVSNQEERWWNEGEPIWVSNEKRNGTKSALCYWPGHNVKYSETRISYSCPLEQNGTKLSDPFEEITLSSNIKKPVFSMEDRVRKILEWIEMEHGPNFIGSYFEEPFKTALLHGTESSEMKMTLKNIDNVVAKLVQGLKDAKLFDKINLVLTSDAGAMNINTEKKIYLEDYLDEKLQSSFDVVDDGPITMIVPKAMKDLNILVAKLNGSNQHMEVYKKEDLPEHFHFKHENRTTPLILVADEEWQVHARRIKDPNDIRKAIMGYSSAIRATHSIFIAKGPAFRKSIRLDMINNVDVYQLLCAAIKLQAKPHNGSGYMLSNIMAIQERWYWRIAKTVVQSKEMLTGIIVMFLVLLFAVLYLLIHVIYNASSRCACPKGEGKTHNQSSYSSNGKVNEGRKHLLANEDELSGSEIDEDSDVNEYEVKYSHS
eukprot:gene17427-19171_t